MSKLLPADIAEMTPAQAEGALMQLVLGPSYRAEATGTDDPRTQAWIERNLRHQFLGEPLEDAKDAPPVEAQCRRFRLRLAASGLSRVEIAYRAQLSLPSIHAYCRYRRPPAAVWRVLGELDIPDGVEVPCPVCQGRFARCRKCRGEGVILSSEALSPTIITAILAGDMTVATPEVVKALARAYRS